MHRKRHGLIVTGSLLILALWMPTVVHAQGKTKETLIPEGVYIKLTKDYYNALGAGASRGVKTYSNDPSTEYLKQISVSSRFTVETNLQILKNQERIIRLLDSVLKNKRK